MTSRSAENATTAPGETGSTDPAPSLANRYGAPKRSMSRRLKTVLVAGALTVGVGLAAYAGIANTNQINYDDVAFEIESETSARVTFHVEKNAADVVQCGVQVLDETYAVVGWKTVTLEASGEDGRESTRRTVDVRTEYLGVSGNVGECWSL
ncbi:DUF4307 domain-containing protein [Zhihengliuella salsuginis]|uniref:DUF4307 domain-containing protein n=1 Tax=Zhihengliuella salsuginis TaxID=578222 RepID=A0ABQ3GL99_9MICC|nr:DUF4307 domain-containing protein [Zhihengliuella salsuginis]GHD09571.1 hypothetical protein GCM10008096_22360 [Zhihengliuella salsuginis]